VTVMAQQMLLLFRLVRHWVVKPVIRVVQLEIGELSCHCFNLVIHVQDPAQLDSLPSQPCTVTLCL
jgi:hypothetical protein